MRVRPATPDPADLARVAALVDGHPLFVPYGLDAARLAVALAAALARGDAVLVADDAARATPLGLAWWTPRGAFGRSAYLRLLVVSATATRGGVGAALLAAVEGAAFAEASDLFALANEANVGARRFYARRGYAEVGRLDDYVAPGLHEVVLRKRRPATR